MNVRGKAMNVRLKNIKGLYIGDICYALDDKIYDGIWGHEDYADGKFRTHDGLEFAVGSTAYGDGTYYGTDGTKYPVDAGVVGVVDLRLATKYSYEELEELGRIVPEADEVKFFAEDGYFEIRVYKDGEKIDNIEIFTADDDCDEEDDYDEEDYVW